ncbi:MAG TPA: hypothetical protein VHM20_04215, partial [Gammaproteobacteria bacterium]|nr:hypothetical protein [Gammaproteobacteria bacterium]
KLYFFWFGASFVSTLWIVDYFSRLITNAENNFFFYDAAFNFLFNWFVLAALARTEKFPGGGKPRFDFLGLIKYLLETRPPQYFYELLKKQYSLEAFAKSEAVGASVLAYDDSITRWLTSTKSVLTKIEDIQSAIWFSYAEWIARSMVTIPNEIKSYCKKGNLTSKLEYLESLIKLAKDTQLKRLDEMVANKIRSLEQKNELDLPRGVISRDTNSDDEWEDILENEKTTMQRNVPLYDGYFMPKNLSSNNIQEGWTEVEKEKVISRNDSGLFRRHRPLKDAARKIIDEMKERKNITAVTSLVTSVNPLDNEFKRELKRRF